MFTKFYQNRLAFVEDMTKTFWCVFYRFTVYTVDCVLMPTDIIASRLTNNNSNWKMFPATNVFHHLPFTKTAKIMRRDTYRFTIFPV